MRGLSHVSTSKGTATEWAATGSFVFALIATLVIALWLFVGFLQLSLTFLAFGGRAGVLDGGVLIQCGLFGYVTWVLLRRLGRGQFSWPRPGRLVANTLVTYAGGWGVGVTMLASRQLALAVQGTLVPAISSALDVVYFVVVTLLFALPGLIAFGIGLLLRRNGS
jgi:hypothetical protein